MKRLWIVLGILFLILAVSGLGLWHLIHVTGEMEGSLEQISSVIEQKEEEQLSLLIADFKEEWHTNEQVMLRYIHHEALDSITGAVARLPALARYEAYPELAAEIARIQELLQHVCEAEIPNWKNIF